MLRYDTRARLERWLYRPNPSWFTQQFANRLYAPIQDHFRRPPIRVTSSDTTSIVVGSLTLGGAGKTPIAALLADELTRYADRTVGLVCRGWGGQAESPRLICSSDPVSDGDEVAMLQSRA